MEKVDVEKYKPHENNPERPRRHKFYLMEGGIKVAYAHLTYRNDIVPSYFVQMIEVKEGKENLGLGSKMVSEINEFLKEKRCLGILFNAIGRLNVRAIYEKQGWKYYKGLDHLGYIFFNEPNFLNEQDRTKLLKSFFNLGLDMILMMMTIISFFNLIK